MDGDSWPVGLKGRRHFPVPALTHTLFVSESWSARVGVVDTEAQVPANKTCAANSDYQLISGKMLERPRKGKFTFGQVLLNREL